MRKYLLPLMCGFVGLVLGGCGVKLVDKKSLQVKTFGGLNFSYRTSQPVKNVSNVPEEHRYVPIHPHDFWISEENNGPIPKSSIKVPRLNEITFAKYGLESDFGGFRVDTYADYSFNLDWGFPESYHLSKHPDEFTRQEREVHLRNYMLYPGTEIRGTGTALTYYMAGYPKNFIPSFNAEFVLNPKDRVQHVIGYNYKRMKLEIERGWDRYNQFEPYEHDRVANIDNHTYYYSIKWTKDEEDERSSFFMRLGVNNLNINSSDERFVFEEGSKIFFEIGAETRY